jgi:hypothetical protein
MTVAMLRLAAVLGARCTYVSARYDEGRLVDHSQKPHEFDPHVVVTP